VRRRQYDRLRAMYVGGRGNATARRYAWFWNRAFRLGLLPRRWVTLEVRGRRTGTLTRFPLGMADVGGQWYVVSMLGECNWVRNVRAGRPPAHPCRPARASRGVRDDRLELPGLPGRAAVDLHPSHRTAPRSVAHPPILSRTPGRPHRRYLNAHMCPRSARVDDLRLFSRV
jgi:hypothetical protein